MFGQSTGTLFLFFDLLWQWKIKLSNSCKLFLYFFSVRINGHYIFTWIIKNQTSLACYRPLFNFDLGQTKAESSLLFILKGRLFWLIVYIIFNPFNINVTVFISWKSYVIFITFTCSRCPTELLDVELIKENKLGIFQRRKLLSVIPGWYMPCFHLLPL